MIIYLITNLINGKLYVGQTAQTLRARWGNHVCNAKRGGGCPALRKAIRKYGATSFKQDILFESSDFETINLYEKAYIKFLNTMSPDKGYNLSPGGDNGARGCKWSPQSRAKLSESCKGNKRSLGKACGPEKRDKIRKALIGHPVSEETKAKIRIARALQVMTKGRKWTVESRVKLSLSLKGKRNSPDTEFKPGFTPWNKGAKVA